MASFKPYPFALINAKTVPIEKAQLSLMTNALHYGSAVFGGLKAYPTPEGIGIFRLDDHVRRLLNSTKILRFPFKLSSAQTKRRITDLSHKNKLKGKTYIRPLIYRCDTDLAPDIEGRYDLAIYMLDMRVDYISTDKGLAVNVSSWQRNSDNALPPRTKASGGYINSSLAIYDAHRAGFDNTILLDENGNVGEGAVMNLFMVKDGQLVTPTTDADILEGITRRTVLELAAEMSIPFKEKTINRSELYTAEEIFFCGTAVEVSWCKSVDHVRISSKPGPVTLRLQTAFKQLPQSHPHLFTNVG